MSLIINHNLSAMQTHRNLGITNGGMTKSIEKLSSGYRINVGADDPSGLIISEQLRAQISGLERAVRNSSEASNLIGIAEGALNEMNNILKKMRALAIHATNNGVTSPEQVAADQSEMDSGIQTIERIANTTRYSDQNLLNGNKQLVYDVATNVNDPADHQLLNTEMTRIDQIFKRSGVKMTVGFNGQKTEWQADSRVSAQRAYLEADPAYALCEVRGNALSADQEFILTGTKGSRLFSFTAGTNVGIVVESINNVKDSTGIGAAMMFGSDVRIDATTTGSLKDPVYPATRADPIIGYNDGTYVYQAGDVQIYNAGLNNVATAAISSFTMTTDAADSFRVGYNCDGDGKIYAKVVDRSTNSIEYYKDKDCTMLIGTGGDDFFASTNNSGIPGAPHQFLDGIYMELTHNAKDLDVYEIAVVGQRLDNQKDFEVGRVAGWADTANAVMSGVNLGVNTSPEGDLYFKYTPLTWDPTSVPKEVATFKVEAFRDSSMEPRYLVGSSGEVAANVNAVAAGQLGGQTVRIESVVMPDGTDSGLNITMNLPRPPYDAATGNASLPSGAEVGNVTFTNVGIRLYAEDYGAQETLRIQNKTGNLFYHYRDGETFEKVMVNSNTTVQIAGQDARFSLNGAPILTTGLIANTSTPDFGGTLAFNGGKLGLTTIAVAGYEAGSLYSRATALQAISENEDRIVREGRFFEPPSLLYSPSTGTTLGLKDRNGGDIDLYLDFSNLDPTVKAQITATTGTPSGIDVSYDQGTGLLTIDASALGANVTPITISVNNADLSKGFYVTDPSVKGLFVKTSDTVANDQGTTTANVMLNIMASLGNELVEVGTWATNPRSNTSETMSNFVGGMQFQLGNTEGDQDRTVYSIQSMAIANIGRIEHGGKEYSLQHVLGGGVASLSRDSIMAMRIIAQAIDDVSTLRARLGAFQKNMLETNINSLNVAVENITKTEAAIRDTDMASESTEFTKNQIMVNAGTSMLAQANQVTQNVLSLLGA